MSDYKLNLASKAATAISGFVVSVILARYLGVALRGEFAFIVQAAGMLAIIFGLGLNQAFPFYFRQRPEAVTYRRFLRLFLVQFAVYAIVAITACVFIGDQTVICLILLLVPAILYQQMESVMAAYDIRLKIWTNIFGSGVRVASHLVMWFFFPSNLLWPAAISAGLWLLMSVVYLVRTGGIPPDRVPRDYVSGVVRFSWLPMLSSLLIVVNYNVDTLMLKWLGTAEDLGNYAVAAGIVIYIWMIPDAIKEVLVSRIVRTHDPRSILLPLKAALLAGVIGVILVVSVGSLAIPALYGSEFRGSYELCAILTVGVLSMIYFKILGTYLLADGRRGFYFAALGVAAVLNIALNLLIIPEFGAVGAAWTCVTSYSLTGIFFVIYFRRLTGMAWSEVLWVRPEEALQLRAAVLGGNRD